MVRVRPSAQRNTTSQPNKKATSCQVAVPLLPSRSLQVHHHLGVAHRQPNADARRSLSPGGVRG